jgi:cyanate lyase
MPVPDLPFYPETAMAIDFDLQIDREANPKGDRVKLTMSGKFLPYKYYGNEQGIPEVGYKEE